MVCGFSESRDEPIDRVGVELSDVEAAVGVRDMTPLLQFRRQCTLLDRRCEEALDILS